LLATHSARDLYRKETVFNTVSLSRVTVMLRTEEISDLSTESFCLSLD